MHYANAVVFCRIQADSDAPLLKELGLNGPRAYLIDRVLDLVKVDQLLIFFFVCWSFHIFWMIKNDRKVGEMANISFIFIVLVTKYELLGVSARTLDEFSCSKSNSSF